jgi:hypothetical protein
MVQNKIYRRGQEQAQELGMITENHAHGKNQKAQTRVEIFLQIETVLAAHSAAVDHAGIPAFLIQSQRYSLPAFYANKILCRQTIRNSTFIATN